LASQEPPEVVLAGAVGEYFDFIDRHPHFVRLLEREALDGGRQLAMLPPHLEAAQEALGAIVTELGIHPADTAEARQLLISMLALSWFHVVHGPTVLRGLGIDAGDPAFREERRQHVVQLVVRGLRGRLNSEQRDRHGLAPGRSSYPVATGPTPETSPSKETQP
jgi:hypothetical protein